MEPTMHEGVVASFSDFARVVRDFFEPAWYTPSIAIGFSILLSIFLVFVLFKYVLSRRPESRKPSKENQMFMQVILSHGLEKFDEEILQELAEVAKIRPKYSLLLDKEVFNRALALIEKREKRDQPELKRYPKVDYLRRLSKKLFQKND
ncbi:MAG: hypothetical protein HQM09_08100 [Candidatus Riflebacteria bacterium]|nr:hypothetical protein [Candidatus Riflebacteria bacterium]